MSEIKWWSWERMVCVLDLVHLMEIHLCWSADACIYQEPAAYCKGLTLSSHKQTLLAVLEIAIIPVVRGCTNRSRDNDLVD